ncbi:hypothetical protein D3C71_1428730 [compost metagenome]
MQLFVQRHQLFLGRLQFFVGGLEFLVDRHQLFIGRLQFLQCGLVFFDHGLQALARVAQFRLDLLGRALLRHAAVGVGFVAVQRGAVIGKQDQEQRFVFLVVDQGLHRQGHHLDAAILAVHDHILAHGGQAGFRGLVQQGAQVQAQPLARQGQHLAGRHAGGGFQVLSGAPGVIDDVAVAVDQHVGRRMLRQHLAVDGLAQRRSAGLRAAVRGMERVRFMHGGQGDRRPRLCADIRAALEDPVFFVDRAEQVVELSDVFRHAQEQIAAWSQRVVERGNDLLLDAAAEIDQQIAA